MMKTVTLLSLALASTVQAQPVPTTEDVTALLRQAGYTDIQDIERDSGVWEADVRQADGRWDDIAIDPVTGEIFDAKRTPPTLDVRAIVERLEAAGYTELKGLDRDGALWDVEARDAKGQAVELTVSGIDGRVVHADQDHDD